jgi:alkylation response protein AidB-like acyl-CoA dehydrogenase
MAQAQRGRRHRGALTSPMLLNPTPDQEFFRETTKKFLGATVPPDEIRRLRDDPAGFDPEYWRKGAELGWSSLLVDEAQGGGTISGAGLVDLALVAYEFGRHAAPGPLVPVNVVASTLSDERNHARSDLLEALLTGTSVATWCAPEALRRHDAAGDVRIDVHGGEVIVRGGARLVQAGGRADHLLVTGRSDRGPTQVLVPTTTRGVTLQPMRTIDLTRRFVAVVFDDVRLPVEALVRGLGEAACDVERQRQLAVVLACAEAVGAMQVAFDMTVEWAFDRYSFGRPLASYQALKHRFADMKTWLEASHAVSDAAATAVDARSPEAPELVSVAKCYVGHYGGELLHECVQLHGGIGVTFEHDLHLYLRRFIVDRAQYGTPAEHRQMVAAGMNREGDAA